MDANMVSNVIFIAEKYQLEINQRVSAEHGRKIGNNSPVCTTYTNLYVYIYMHAHVYFQIFVSERFLREHEILKIIF